MSEIRYSIVLSFLAFFTLVIFLLGPTAAAELGTTAAAEVVAAVVTELGTKANAADVYTKTEVDTATALQRVDYFTKFGTLT